MPEGLVDSASICYCGGVGEDIRFEEALAGGYGATVWAFDPTPRSIAFIERGSHPDRFSFRPFGLWSDDRIMRFFAPANPEHVSHSVEGPLGGEGYFDAQCRSVPSLMRELGHDRLTVLKMNIEGAEDRVLAATLEAGIRPTVIALTWEGQGAFRKALRWTRRLRDAGYRLLGSHGWFFTYVDGEA
jgi:FkbM family methyltransferase